MKSKKKKGKPQRGLHLQGEVVYVQCDQYSNKEYLKVGFFHGRLVQVSENVPKRRAKQ